MMMYASQLSIYLRSDRSVISPNIPGVLGFELHDDDDDDVEVGKIFYRYTRRSSWLCGTLRDGIPTKNLLVVRCFAIR
jgi:hypothetical protein